MKRTRFNDCYFYTYITTNIINGKQYIGSRKTKILHIENDHYIGSGVLFLKAIKKYGRMNFTKTILNTFSNRKEAFDAEAKYIIKYNTLYPFGYNISPKGGLHAQGCHSKETKLKLSKFRIGKKHSEESKNKMSIAHKGKFKGKNSSMYGKTGKNNPRFGTHHTEESIRKMSISHKGHITSKEHREKLSKATKGIPKTEEQNEKNRKAHLGKITSEETRKKQSESRIKYFKSEAGILQKLIISKQHKGKSFKNQNNSN